MTIPASAENPLTRRDIRTAQSALIHHGYPLDDPRGVWRDSSAKALKNYQKDWGLPVTGELTQEILARLDHRHPDTRPQWVPVAGQPCRVWSGHKTAKSTATWDGPCKDGNADGRGVLEIHHYRNGERHSNYRYEGRLQAGKRVGQGITIHGTGKTHKGDYVDDRPHGSGITVWENGDRYDGTFVSGNRTGSGTFTWANGNLYSGDFVDGERTGNGRYVWAAGGRYEGAFVKGRFHGTGTLTLPGVGTYTGSFEGGDPNGKGITDWENGDRYEGDVINGEAHGHGVKTWAFGDRYEGGFIDNRQSGYGTFTWAIGARYTGLWVNDLPHGEGTYVNADGETYQGVWQNGCFTDGTRNAAIGIPAENCNR